MNREISSPGNVLTRLVMLGVVIAFVWWVGWSSDWNAFLRIVARFMLWPLLLIVPFALWELKVAARHAKIRDEEIARAYRSSGRHDTAPGQWQGAGAAPDGWE